MLLQGCDLLFPPDPQPAGPFDSLYAFVQDDLGYEPVRPPGAYYPPGTIVDGEAGGGLVVISHADGCFLGAAGLAPVAQEHPLNTRGWANSSADQEAGVANTLLGLELSFSQSKVKSLEVEISSILTETVSLEEIHTIAREGGIDEDCRALVKGHNYRVVLESVRVEGLRLSVETTTNVNVAIDTGNVSEYLSVRGELHASVSQGGEIAPAVPIYIGVKTRPLPELPEGDGEPMLEVPDDVIAEVPLLWCCDAYGRPRCELQQATTQDTLCQCESMTAVGTVCETSIEDVSAATEAPPPLEPQDPCAILSGGPIRACGANLGEDLDPNMLYVCYLGRTLRSGTCATRCNAAPLGMIDFCEDPDPCANAARDGAVCGGNLAPVPWAETATLYTCSGLRTATAVPCPSQCVTGGADLDDFCL